MAESQRQRIVESEVLPQSRDRGRIGAFAAAPMVFLYFYNELYAVQPWIIGFKPPVIFNGQRWLDVSIARPKP